MKTKTITVYVTEECIELGKRGIGCQCPIALSLKKSGFSQASMGCRHLWINGIPMIPPSEVVDFVRNFDKGKLALPFNFQITVPV